MPNGATPKNFFLVDEHLVNVKPALQKIMTETKWEEGLFKLIQNVIFFGQIQKSLKWGSSVHI